MIVNLYKRVKNSRQQEKRLFSNTFFLYLLTFSTQLFSLATVPYLTRVLGAVVYGKVGLALAYMAYAQIILDFGFLLSATEKIVIHRDNPETAGRILTAVTCAKVILAIIVSALFTVFVETNGTMKGDSSLYLLYYAAYVANALMPDFFYRGIEEMKVITYRTLAIRGFCMGLTFVFIHSPADCWKIPLFVLIGNAVSAVVMYVDMARKHRVVFQKISIGELWQTVKDTLPFFASRIASTAYQAVNTIILGFVYGTSAVVGYYTSADKIVSISKTASGPISDSLYPYMIKEKNYALVKKILKIFMPVILAGTVLLFVFAKPICVILFGAEYAQAGSILRCLLPIVVVILPTYILCFPVMVPMGLSKYANLSNIVGMCSQGIGLAVLLALHHMDVFSLCILTSFTEVFVFAFRLAAILIGGKKFRAGNIGKSGVKIESQP